MNANCWQCGLEPSDPGRLGIEPAYDAKDRPRWQRMSQAERDQWSDAKLGTQPCTACGRRS